MIRLARPTDASALHQLMLDAFTPFRDQYTAGCFDATILDARRIEARMREGPVWIACAEEQAGKPPDTDALRHPGGTPIPPTPLGTVSAVQRDGVYIRGMAVHPSARRMGIGSHLLAEVRRWSPGRLWLSTTPFLHGSIKLYQSFGFLPCDGPADLLGTPLVSFELPA